MSCTFHSSLNYVSDILDEIALEGLDGITLETLWMRLSVRPKFMFTIDEGSKKFLWNLLIQLNNLNFYEIPNVRPSLKYYDYSISEEIVCNEIRIELEEVYPYSSVKNVPGIFGSCQYYSERIDITSEVLQMTLEDVEYKWGNKLVVVASQDCRNSALLGNCCTPNIDFSNSPLNYEILERIGRCRQLGCLTCGKGSLQALVTDVKSIFHYIKCLMSHKLVKKQSLLGSLSSNSHASLVYLTRFFEETANENISILRLAIEELKARPPHYMMPCDELYSLFDEQKKKRIKKYKTSVVFRRYITVTPVNITTNFPLPVSVMELLKEFSFQSLPYRTVYPNAPQVEWEKKSKSGERTVRCFKLLNPNVELTDIVEKECDSDDEEGNSGFLPKGIYYKNMPIVFQAYHHIKNAGAKGLSHGELGQIMGLNKYFIRGLIKRLDGDKLCKFYFETDGKRRSKRYIVGEHAQTKAAASEIAQILLETTNKEESRKQNGHEVTTPGTPEKQTPKLKEENMSYRGLKRVGLIIKTIKAHRFRLFHQIKKFVHEEEKKEGLTITVDRQTIQKLLEKLETDGLIKKFVLTGKEEAGNSLKIYTDPAFDPDEKMKENIYASHATCTSFVPDCNEDWTISLENEFSMALMENLSEMQQMLNGVVRTAERPSARESELTYLYSPKFIRLNILHDFIFHLVYDYTGLQGKIQEELMEELSRTTAVDDDLKAEMPKLYGMEPSTYMFVPPLNNSGKIPGWFLISDLLTRMPLSMMVRLIKVTESCPELWKYLHHPVRKHFLVKDLPLTVRRIFFCRKNQISNFYFDIRRLSFMGLIQFGPRFGKEYYQTILYLNRKASLLDTSPSPPAYIRLPADIEFSVKRYEFLSKNDVKKYWMDMFDICMGTKLGEKEHTMGDEVLNERELTKESLKKYCEPKSVEQAMQQDDGNIPGDHLGAAGLDSGMFSFLRNNWTGPVTKNMSKSLDSGKVKKLTKVPFQKLKKEHKKFDKERKKFGSIKTRRKLIAVNTDKVLSIPKVKSKKKVKVVHEEQEREVKRLRKPSYDETDLEALKLMNTLRVTWSTAEDNLLLLCRVAMMFLCPNPKAFAKIPQSEVRRALQEYIPESRNKTQKAIARRVVYMMKNPTTVRSVNTCLEGLKEMPESKAFDCTELVEKIKPSAADLVERQRELYEKFHELLAFLKEKFIDTPNSNPGKDNKDLIPDSLEEFLEKFHVETPIRETIDIKCIRENVIRGVLMSSFCCRSDKTSSAVQLFEIYRQYNEDELQNAIKSLHSDRVITIKKKAGSAMFKSGNILPLTFSPFKLSFAFQHLLNMKYAHSIFPESYAQVMRLQMSDMEELQVDLNECNIALFLLASKGILSFKAILPEQIIALDKGELSDSTYSKMVVKYCKMLEYSQSNSKVVCTSGKVISKSDVKSLKVDESNKRKMTTDEEGVQAKRGRGEEEDETTDEPFGEEPSRVEEPGRAEFGSEKKTRSSRVILYMMREEAKKDAKHPLGGRLVQEFCVVNSSQVFIKCKKDELEAFASKMDANVVGDIVRNIVSRSLYPINLVDENSVVENMKEKSDITMAKAALDLICSKKELGATVEDLKSICGPEALRGILQSLMESKIILRSGITETRYVSQKYSTPWLLSSFKMKRIEREKMKPNDATAVALAASASEDENPKKKIKGIVDLKSEEYNPPACSSSANNKIKLIIRPWIRIDGSLNRKVLDRFLGTILGFVMTRPGCTLRDVMDNFVPSIIPIWTKDLVEILFEIGCVELNTFRIIEKATLFSKCQTEICDKYTGLEDDKCVAVEAKVDAVATLGLFIGKKTYSRDFLSD